MTVQDYRKSNAQQYTCRHDDCKDDRAKVFYGVVDEELTNRRANAEHEKV